MKLEQAIKSKAITNSKERAILNIFFTNNWLQANMQAYFKKYDLTIQQYNALRIIRGQLPQPATVAIIKERMMDKMSDASRITDRLEKLGFVTRVVCKDDKRRVHIHLTQKGVELMNKMDQTIVETQDLMKKLNEEELASLNIILDKIRF